MAEYKSNSHKTRDGVSEPEKSLAPVITGTAVTQKKSGFGRIAGSIIAEDLHSVGSYILTDVLIPALKKSLDDIVSNGIHMLLYGKAAESRSGVSASRISYGSYYSKSQSEPLRANPSASALDYDNIIFSNRGDAEAVLVAMEDILDNYQVVSIGDLYELSDIPTPNYTVNKYGWTNLRSAQVIRVSEGYMLKLPRALPIN